jgi:hypothetical protein
VIYLTLGNSQAMKTAWIEDLLSFVPPIAFLAASWIERRPPNRRFPFGYIRATSIAYLVSAVALAGIGVFLVIDASSTLIRGEHPTIGSVALFGASVWLGWLMMAALAYSVVLPVIFGRMKMRLAKDLHDKVLWADALMNKADWLTGLAAAVGVVGIGFGWWWADAAAALFIAADVSTTATATPPPPSATSSTRFRARWTTPTSTRSRARSRSWWRGCRGCAIAGCGCAKRAGSWSARSMCRRGTRSSIRTGCAMPKRRSAAFTGGCTG